MSTKDTSGSTPQHSHPHNNTMSRNEKFWVDQVTVPQPPPGNDKGWGTTRGGGGISYANIHNYYGPYAYCSLDQGVACAQHIQLPTYTCTGYMC